MHHSPYRALIPSLSSLLSVLVFLLYVGNMAAPKTPVCCKPSAWPISCRATGRILLCHDQRELSRQCSSSSIWILPSSGKKECANSFLPNATRPSCGLAQVFSPGPAWTFLPKLEKKVKLNYQNLTLGLFHNVSPTLGLFHNVSPTLEPIP